MEHYIGFALPPFIDYLNKNVHNDAEKAWMTVFLCLIVAAIIEYPKVVNGTFADAVSILQFAGIIIGEAMSIYSIYWKTSPLRVALPGNGVSEVPLQG